jgi:hypothetical protein
MRADWFNGNGLGQITAAAGTRIRRLLPPAPNGRLRLVRFIYTNSTTAHTLTAARPIGRSTATAAAASGQAVVSVASEMGVTGNLLAANDLVAVREVDGVTRLYTVSAVPASYPGNVTLTGNFTSGVGQGARVWNFGILTDVDPVTGLAHPTFALPASATTTLADETAGVVATHVPDDPILLDSDNATAAGTVVNSCHCYTRDQYPLS